MGAAERRSAPFGAAVAIRFLRERLGISARKLSMDAKLSPSYVGKIEKGECEPSLRAFAVIARELQMTPYEVWAVVCHEGNRQVDDAPVSVTPPEHNRISA